MNITTELMERRLSKHRLNHLGAKLNILGLLLFADEIGAHGFSVKEILWFSRELHLRFCQHKVRSSIESIRKYLSRLESAGLVLRLDRKNIGRKLSHSDRFVRHYYVLSSEGIEVLRYIYPYNMLVASLSSKTTCFFPVPYEQAADQLRQFLNAKRKPGLNRMKEMSIMGSLGRLHFVLKVESEERLEKNLKESIPGFPLVSREGIYRMFQDQGVPLTTLLLDTIEEAFCANDYVLFPDFLLHFIKALECEFKVLMKREEPRVTLEQIEAELS